MPALRPFACPACGPSLLLRWGADEMQVRCLRCRGTPVHLSLLAAIRAHVPDPASCRAYELSTVGPVPRWLRRHCQSLATSEYLDGVAPGSTQRGIRCEDVQRLSFDDARFERARRVGDRDEHLLPPAFHGDRLRGPGAVLVYRDYGSDLVDRVRAAGFSEVQLWSPVRDCFGHRRQVLVARR